MSSPDPGRQLRDRSAEALLADVQRAALADVEAGAEVVARIMRASLEPH